jgi:hypothetical protein
MASSALQLAFRAATDAVVSGSECPPGSRSVRLRAVESATLPASPVGQPLASSEAAGWMGEALTTAAGDALGDEGVTDALGVAPDVHPAALMATTRPITASFIVPLANVWAESPGAPTGRPGPA